MENIHMVFREALPENCPPSTAHGNGCDSAFRLVSSERPNAGDFASHSAKGQIIPAGVCPCRWASCSLFADLETIKKKLKFKTLKKYGFAAKVKVAPGSGLIIEVNSHIDFWMFDTFDPVAAITRIEAL